ncbi:hypothetical protein ACLOJK_034882 [Asimina triloba]
MNDQIRSATPSSPDPDPLDNHGHFETQQSSMPSRQQTLGQIRRSWQREQQLVLERR